MKIKSLLIALVAFVIAGCGSIGNRSIIIDSPGGKNKIQFKLEDGIPYYSVNHREKEVVKDSRLGFVFKNDD